MKIKTLLLLSFVLCTATNYFAQSISLGPQLGFIKSTDADQTSLMPGLAARLSLLGFGIEGSVYYKYENFENGSVKTKSYPINITLLWKVLPLFHAEGGIGWYNTKIDANILDVVHSETKSNAGYHIGAGMELPLSGVTLTADIRYVFLNIGSAESFKSNFTAVMIGVLFTL
jgi:opacity protein-like surface antigen